MEYKEEINMSKKQQSKIQTPTRAQTQLSQDLQVQKLQQKVEELTNNWKRSLADYQNLLKRTESDKRDFAKFAAVSILSKLIPALDLLEMAATHSDDQGLRLAVKNFQDVLRSENVQEISPQPGDPFNAELHECTETVDLPAGRSAQENTLAEVVLKGYKIDTFIIRPAKVKVWNGQVQSANLKSQNDNAKPEN